MSEQKTVTLDQLLDETQRKQVFALMQDIHGGADVQSLRNYLVTQRESLEARGVIPEYLFYSLAYQFKLFS